MQAANSRYQGGFVGCFRNSGLLARSPDTISYSPGQLVGARPYSRMSVGTDGATRRRPPVLSRQAVARSIDDL